MTDAPGPGSESIERRRDWLAALARADRAELEAALSSTVPQPDAMPLRPAETGMVMVRARVGGSDNVFNFGEATVSRCAVQFADGRVGVGYVLGRDRRKAELVALIDGALQDAARHDELWHAIVEPIRRVQAQRSEAASRSAAASTVEFFTLVRGET